MTRRRGIGALLLVAIIATVFAASGLVAAVYEFGRAGYWCSVPQPLDHPLICADTQRLAAGTAIVGVIGTLVALFAWIWVREEYS